MIAHVAAALSISFVAYLFAYFFSGSSGNRADDCLSLNVLELPLSIEGRKILRMSVEFG